MELDPKYYPLIVGIGTLLVGLGVLIGNRLGRNIAERGHALNIHKATPHIGCLFEMQHVLEPLGRKRHTILTTVYNYGELAATAVKGKWNLEVSHQMQPAEKPIGCDSLASGSPWKDEHTIGGNTNWIDSEQNVLIKVNIQLTYTGLDGKPQPYSKCQTYDKASGKFIDC